MNIDSMAKNFPEVAAAFDLLCDTSGITDREIAEAAQCAAPTIGRIRTGENEPRVVLFTRACLRMGKTPNDLLLNRPGEARLDDPAFDADEHADFARIVETFKSIKRKNNGPVSPVKMFTEALIAVDETIPAPAVQAVVQLHADGVKTIEPAPDKEERTRKGDTGKSDRLDRVSEPDAEYGEKTE